VTRRLNLGILAHVDAGKTTLTERLLYAAGIIQELGSVDDGTTQTDSMDLERRRGITIRSAVVSFEFNGVAINLIDTPGHPDFIAEVERILDILDGAVLVVSAVEGVQPQTRVLMRALRRLRIPTLVFVNKIDRMGAGNERIQQEMAEKLGLASIAMGKTSDLGSPEADFHPHQRGDETFTTELVDLVSRRDDAILSSYVAHGLELQSGWLWEAFRTQVRRSEVYPVLFGSAITGAGVSALATAITDLLPDAVQDEAVLSATIFKIDRGPAGEKIAYLRVFAGSLTLRRWLRFAGRPERRVTKIRVFEHGSAIQRPSIKAGQIGQVWGLAEARIGDSLGAVPSIGPAHHFAPPTLEAVIVPAYPRQGGALYAALTQLAEQDPLINLRQDDVRGETYLSLYGEVQKEVVKDTLAAEYGIEARFQDTTPICIERLLGVGNAVENMGQDDNPFLATVGLEIGPASAGSGVEFRPGAAVGALPLAFQRAIKDTVRLTLEQGLLGWAVPDCVVTLTHTGYAPRQSAAHQGFNKAVSSTGADFRGLTPLVLLAALADAGTVVHEPVHHFRLQLPVSALGRLLPKLARLRASPEKPHTRGDTCELDGEIPAASVHELQQELPGMTGGDGLLEFNFARYRPVPGPPPRRPRTDDNPLNRREYLLRLTRRV
jgi:ribosomal protection tetracycline resistance protein